MDSAGPACGGEPESAEATNRFFSALRELRVATLTLAHVSKDRPKHAFGSVYWQNHPRRVYRLSSDQRPGDSSFVLGLTNTKSNWGQRLAPIGLRVAFEGDAVTFDRADIRDVPELEQERSLRVRMKDLLARNEGMPVQEIAHELDENDNQVRARLNDGKGKDFTNINPGEKVALWGLVSHRENQRTPL